ncbi:MAG: HEAT repeat domain-containing protein [Candidatus Heimdallarchaeota archaeon]|nr:HEAT repeat domain-containing protein [Candidatus Heimdallarchaeota archaeon]
MKKKKISDNWINDLKELQIPTKNKKERKKEISEFLRILEEEDDDDLLFWAVTRLTEMGSKVINDNFSVLEKVLEDKDKSSRVKTRILLSLTNLKKNKERVIDILKNSILNEPDVNIRRNSAICLGDMRAKDATKALIEALLFTEKEQEVRIKLAWALSRIKTKEALEAIKEAISNEEQVDLKFEFAYFLVLEEGKDSEGIKVIQKLLNGGDLSDKQKVMFEGLLGEVRISKKFGELENNLDSLGELIRKDADKKEILKSFGLTKINMLEIMKDLLVNIEAELSRPEFSAELLIKYGDDVVRLTNYIQIQMPEQKKSWIRKHIFALLGAIGTLISAVAALLGWLSAILGWI